MFDRKLHKSRDIAIKKGKSSQNILIAYGVIFGYLSFINSPFATIFALLSILAIAFYDKYIALSVYICTMVVAPEFTNMELAVSMMEVLGIGTVILLNTEGRLKRLLIIDLAFVFFVASGMILGLDTQIVTVFIYAFNLLLSVFIARMVYDRDDDVVLLALLVAGIIVSAITLHLFMTDQFYAIRIGYKGNSKDLSTVIVFPVFMAINKMLGYKNHKSKVTLFISFGIFFVSLPLLLLTYSRGVMISLIVATCILYILYSKGIDYNKIILVAIIGGLLYYMVGNMNLSYRMWFDNLEGGNGRTRIWEMYLNYMGDKGALTTIFGLGTASQKDVIGWYPHSLILGHLFHFGIFGFMFILFQTLTPLLNLYKRRKAYPFQLCLLILTVMMFFPHGTYYEPLFWVIIGISFGIIYKRNIKMQNI